MSTQILVQLQPSSQSKEIPDQASHLLVIVADFEQSSWMTNTFHNMMTGFLSDVTQLRERAANSRATAVLNQLKAAPHNTVIASFQRPKEPDVAAHYYYITIFYQLNFYGSDLKLLEETFGKENLPEELGGELPPGDDLAKEWQTKMESKAAVFEELKNYKIELTHEITDKKSDENVNFLTGTYRKLNVD
ncbi:hypothetical protein CAPTEDRAFT_186868 [Capitella teleta]|uniref:Uncharacterized protein n=1 Tax=Capitella teleta TaxID=283909 RepID=R7U1R1_CAPTE|nr:hypothetical protein CAPTEDRAFT_186868 [Capitella teleta]|eukprot:ELT97606.1 hypothetical protein CAPTEDRAFT_186868 [Capitella teleta]